MPVAYVALTDTTAQTLVAAPTSGKIRVRHMAGSNAGASLTRIDVKTADAVKWSFACGANGGGFTEPLGEHPWELVEGEALKVQQSAAVTSYVTVIYEVY